MIDDFMKHMDMINAEWQNAIEEKILSKLPQNVREEYMGKRTQRTDQDLICLGGDAEPAFIHIENSLSISSR